MSFFEGVGDFFKGIAPAAAGTLTSFIPGVGPLLAPVAAGATNSLLNGGSSGGGSSGGGFSGGGFTDAGQMASLSPGFISQMREMDMIEKMFNFENDSTRFLDSGGEYLYFDAEKDYNDSLRSQNYFDNIYGAVQGGDLDYFEGKQMLQSAFRPNSEFYSGKDFQNYLSAEVGKKTTNNIIQDAFSTNLMRPGSVEEVARLSGWLDATGQNKSPMQIASAVNRNLMGSLEGESKGPYTLSEKNMAAAYGGFGRNPDGSKNYMIAPYRRGGSVTTTMKYGDQFRKA